MRISTLGDFTGLDYRHKAFMIWAMFNGAGLFVLPVIAINTIGVYRVFRGKVRKGYD